MKLRTAALRARITIEQLTETRGETGALVKGASAWSSLAERWAEVLDTNSRRWERLSAIYNSAAIAFRCRGYVAVTPRMRVSHDSRVYQIIGVETEENRKPEKADVMTLICEGSQ